MASERVQRQIGRLLDEAEEASARQDWNVVHARTLHVLTFDPQNADALAFLSAAERALGVTLNSAPPPTQSETSSTDPQPSPVNVPEAERRQLTVMFCDLQDSTALSQQLDPEELRDVIRSYQEVCADAVVRFEGHIAKYLGDGLLIYFGYPQAHEDDPQRAVRSGLSIIEDMSALNHRLRESSGLELAVRIGVHTGLVVAGEMGGGDTVEAMAIVGETPNIAARLQEAAEPNSLVVSDISAGLISGFFLSQSLGFHELKGIAEPMELFAVLSESGARTRFEVAAARLTPLVGREQELGLLLDRWEQAKEGLGQVVLLSGEPGIGKSRLIDALTERMSREQHNLRRLRCSAYHQNSALHPVLEYLEGWLGFGREDSAEDRLDKLESALARVDFPLVEAVQLLSGLLSVPLTERFPAFSMSPEMQRERARELLVALLLETTEDRPVFLVVEDLHWADPSTLAMLGLLVDQVPTANVLALLSFRPDFTPSWPSRAHVTPVSLNRLTRRLAGEMVDRLTGGKSLPDEVFSQVAAKSDGVPLFVEELTRMVVESDLLREVGGRYELTGLLPPLAIPSTLQDSLTARLDHLAEERDVAQVGAVLGREFTYELIQAISLFDEETLRRHLQQLVDAEFLYQRGLPPESTYVFKHALIQDAVYNSLLISRRQQYHQRTAQALEEGFADIVESQPELLAHHFAEAALTEQAVNYWLKAGERALVSYAYEEALTHFERGLIARDRTLSGTEAASDKVAAALLFGLARAQASTLDVHDIREALQNFNLAFDYYAGVGDVEQAVSVAEYPGYGFTSERAGVTQLIERALRLVSPGSLQEARLLTRYGIALQHHTEGNEKDIEDSFDRALTIARREGDTSLEMRMAVSLGTFNGSRNRSREALEHFERAIALRDSVVEPEVELNALYGAAGYSINFGSLQTAERHASSMLTLAEQMRDRWWLTSALWRNAVVNQLQGNWSASREFSDRGLEVTPGHWHLLAGRAILECEVGEFAQAREYLDRLTEALALTGPLRTGAGCATGFTLPLVARITGIDYRLEIAEETAEAILASPTATPNFARRARLGLGLLSIWRDDVVMAAEQYAALEQIQSMTSDRYAMCGERVLALLSQTIGDLDRAIYHSEAALTYCRNAGYRPELAWTCCDYADILTERDIEGDRAKAIALLDESLAFSNELGMRPLMERVLSRRKILGA